MNTATIRRFTIEIDPLSPIPSTRSSGTFSDRLSIKLERLIAQ